MTAPFRPSLASALAGLLALLSFSVALAAEGYLRHPDVHGDLVVFTAEGDLWLASTEGGQARRLTTHPGTELLPSFSPDGKHVAFSSLHDGNLDVQVIPASGGEPRRLTWHPGSDEVIGWTPDGTHVIFRSRRDDPHGSHELFTVPLGGGDPTKLPLGWAARLDIDPETGRYAFNRRHRETRTWKRYRGGTATDIWVGHPDREDHVQVTHFAGMDAYPMWHGGRIYFLSDQGGTANLWSMQPDGSDRRRHAEGSTWDVRWPAMSPDGRIVYGLAGDLRLHDVRRGTDRRIPIELPSERTLTRNRYEDGAESLTWFDLSEDGERLAVTTRGEIFSVPVEEGVTLPVTRGSGSRESWASFTADGKQLVYLTDEGGEESVRIRDSWGRGEVSTLVAAGLSGWHFPPVPSPDGQWIAWSDQTQTLWIARAKPSSRPSEPIRVDRSEQAEIRHHAWSPDGRWLAYEVTRRTEFGDIRLFDTKARTSHDVTGPTTNDHDPAWDPAGRYLYFLSDRTMNPVIGGRDFSDVEVKTTRPYLVLLREDVENPLAARAGLPPKDDGEGASKSNAKSKTKAKTTGQKGDDDEGEKKAQPVEIDLDGLSDRIVELPVEAGQYSALGATSKHVLWLSAPVQGMAEEPGWDEEPTPATSLVAFDLEEKEEETWMPGVAAYRVAHEGDKLAISKGGGRIFVVDADSKPDDDLDDAKVDLSDLVIELDPREEWAQIFHEGWRHMRDFHWDPTHGGLDWEAVRDQYASLLPRIATRDELRDLMGEVIGELTTSHTYVWGGDAGQEVGSVATGLLGADFERAGADEQGAFFRVARVYRGDAADRTRSPLREPGVGVKEGHHVFAVNHQPLAIGEPFLAALEGLAGKAVVLTVNDRASRTGARDVVVETLRSEQDLRYSDWVRRNREEVARLTGGGAGYIHVPDMDTDGMVEFDTWFYPQLDKKGMVVDVRWNGGGYVSQLLLERFRRRVLSFDRAAGGGVSTYPYRVLNGPIVVLTNQFAGSDGDIFPRAVQLEGLAPVIGMRSWGGVVGIRADKRLVDGGGLTQPEFAWWDPVDGWGLENRGVIPDIEVENRPEDVARGVDAQLERAVEVLAERMRSEPGPEPQFGPTPVKTREAYEKRELR